MITVNTDKTRKNEEQLGRRKHFCSSKAVTVNLSVYVKWLTDFKVHPLKQKLVCCFESLKIRKFPRKYLRTSIGMTLPKFENCWIWLLKTIVCQTVCCDRCPHFEEETLWIIINPILYFFLGILCTEEILHQDDLEDDQLFRSWKANGIFRRSTTKAYLCSFWRSEALL